jgi:chemotaxis protein methyltransferase CheR
MNQTPACTLAPLPLTDRAYRRLGGLVLSRFGIYLAPEKKPLIANRLHRYVRALGLATLDDYVDYLLAEPSGRALDTLADLVACCHTSFFREPGHFEFLRSHILPELESRLDRAAGPRDGERDLRLWCAAAATGEEAYSLVMTMLDHFGPHYARFDAGLLATDLSLRALRQASAGSYTPEQVQQVPARLRQCYLRLGDDGRFAVTPAVRSEVLFRKFNLVTHSYPFKKPFHVIFCRNVLIYFDAATRRRVAARLCACLAPGGYLLVGHAERIDPGAEDTALLRPIRPAVYQKSESGWQGRRGEGGLS